MVALLSVIRGDDRHYDADVDKDVIIIIIIILL